MYIVEIFLTGSLVDTWTGYAASALEACNLAEKFINPCGKIMYCYQARIIQD